MTAKKVTISLPENMVQFLDENPSFSLSHLAQAKVAEIMESIKHNPQLIEALQHITKLEKVIKNQQEFLQQAYDQIETLKKGVI